MDDAGQIAAILTGGGGIVGVGTALVRWMVRAVKEHLDARVAGIAADVAELKDDLKGHYEAEAESHRRMYVRLDNLAVDVALIKGATGVGLPR